MSHWNTSGNVCCCVQCMPCGMQRGMRDASVNLSVTGKFGYPEGS